MRRAGGLKYSMSYLFVSSSALLYLVSYIDLLLAVFTTGYIFYKQTK
jgi:hypothetical protein